MNKNGTIKTTKPLFPDNFQLNLVCIVISLLLVLILFFSGIENTSHSILFFSMIFITFSSLFWGNWGSLFSTIFSSLIFSGFHFFYGGGLSWIDLIFFGIFFSFAKILVANFQSVFNYLDSGENKIGNRDLLTGVFHRYYLTGILKELEQKKDLPISIMMVDINGLKFFNDAYGNDTGDELLKNIAWSIESVLGEKDLLVRWGDDEFVAILIKTDSAAAQRLAREVTKKTRGLKLKGKICQVAIGIATKEKPEGSLEEVLQKAEDRMERQKLLASKSKRGTVLSILLRTLREKSFETNSHALRMQDMGKKIAGEIGLKQEEIDRLTLLLSLHDLGKITVPESILKKPGKLNKKEWTIVKRHPETGYRIAKNTDELSHIAKEILSHHERWDGKGYPRGLQGEEIPLLARITSVVDAFDVMTNDRPYQKARSKKEAISELRRCAGTQFDPKIVRIFCRLFRKKNNNLKLTKECQQ